MERIIKGFVPIAIGIFYIAFISKSINNEDMLRKYLENSPKAYIWRKLFGIERTIELTRRVFVPIGLVISCLLILGGICICIINPNL